MKTFKKQTKEEMVVDTVTCNGCCKAITMHDDSLQFDYTFGYNSEKFGDMIMCQFDLCEECIYSLVETFKIPPKLIDRDAVFSSRVPVDDEP